MSKPLTWTLAILGALALSLPALSGVEAASRSLDKQEVKKVKQVAKKQIKRKAPKLSVANAAALAGLPPSAYLDRIVQRTSGADATTPVPGTSATEILAPVSIDVPVGVGFVRVDGSAAFDGNPVLGITSLWFQQDGMCAKSGFGWDNRAYANVEFQATTFHLAVPVTPGTHSYRLCSAANLPADARARTLLVETVAG